MKGLQWLEDPRIKQAGRTAKDMVSRSMDRHVRLAVTGLSRSGKTAFITSLINQLLEGCQPDHLPFLTAVREGRLHAVQRQVQPHLHLPSFRYEAAIDSLTGNPATWPEPTNGISELRLALRYRTGRFLARQLGEQATLYLDITDYPGEWLLDLPMLSQTYLEWSAQAASELARSPRNALAAQWLKQLEQLDPLAPADERRIADLAETYAELLGRFRHELGLYLIQPGRFILPGELAGAPLLHFFPLALPQWLEDVRLHKAGADTLYGCLKSRFDYYQEHVVKGFYRQHFAKFDRQVVLADSLQALNEGPDSFRDLRQALELILQSYHYGRSNILRRLFAPRIDKLLFVASKADHITADQQQNLEALLHQLVKGTENRISFAGIDCQVMAAAAIRATEAGFSQWKGGRLPSIKGRDMEQGQIRILYPGDVPRQLPKPDFWDSQGFHFLPFAPGAYQRDKPLPHIRMDRVIEYLLGDKLS